MADLKSSTPKDESWTNQAQRKAQNAYDELSGSKDTPRSVQHSSVPGSFDFDEGKNYSAGDSNYTSQSHNYDSTSPTFKASEGDAHGEPGEQPSLANKLMSAIGIGGSSEGATSQKDKPLAGEDAAKNSVSTKTLEKQAGKAHSYVDNQGNEFEVVPTDRNVKYSSLVDPVVDQRDIHGTEDNIKGLSEKERAQRRPVDPADTKNAKDSQTQQKDRQFVPDTQSGAYSGRAAAGAGAGAGAGAAAGHYSSSSTDNHGQFGKSGSYGHTSSGNAGGTSEHRSASQYQKSDFAAQHDTTDKNLGPEVPGAGVGSLAGAPGQTYHPKQSQALETQQGYGISDHASKRETDRGKGFSNTGAAAGAAYTSGKPVSYNTTGAADTDPVHGATAPADLGDYRHPIGEHGSKNAQGKSHKTQDKHNDLSQKETAAFKSRNDHHGATETAAGAAAGAGLGAAAGRHEKSTSTTSDSSDYGSGSGAGSKSGKPSKWGKSGKKNDDTGVQHGTVYQDVHHDTFATRNAGQLKSDSSRLHESEKKGQPEFAQKQAELGYETAHGGSHTGAGAGAGAGIGAAVASAAGYKAAPHNSSYGKQQGNDASTQELRGAPGVTKTENDPYDSSYGSQGQTDERVFGSLDPKSARNQIDHDKLSSQAKDVSQKGGQQFNKAGHGEHSAYATGAGTAIGAGAGYLGSREAGKDSTQQANVSAQKDPELAKGGFRDALQGGGSSHEHTQTTNKYSAGVGETTGRNEPETNKYTAGVGSDEPQTSSGYTAGVGDTHPHHAKDQYTAGVRDDEETPYTAGFSDTAGQSKYSSGSGYGAAAGAAGAGIASKSHEKSQGQSYGNQGATYGATQQTSTGKHYHIPGTRDNLETQDRGHGAHGNDYLNDDQNALANRAAAAATHDKRGASDLGQSGKARQQDDEAYTGQPQQGESSTKILDYDEFEKAQHPHKEKLSTKIKKIFN
ncbi:hypothetical protein KL919_000691 [Ogataea angusta]|nr:hypothetical protein KL943_001554 [Ogataea angusta]KAG7863376.1 hypothetical protein KL919_000691 [Ogataea angusta]